jgi:hypothetical protein
MHGKEGAEVLIGYCARRLAPAVAAEFEKHLEACSDCRRAVNAQREVWESMDGWAPMAVSADFDARLYARIAQEEAAPAWRKTLRRFFTPAVPIASWKPAVSLVAACAVLVFSFVIRTPEPRETAAKQIRTERVDIEQVEKTLADLEILTPAGTM